MLSNLQVLRGVAALGVVFFHTDYLLPGGWHTEFFGVATFFIISGFIMCFITRDNADGFLAKRLVRIVPLYWLCTLAALLITFGFAVFEPSTWSSPLDGRPGEPLWSYTFRSLLFLPLGDKYPFLNLGWSLNYEMYFYLIFAGALSVDRRLAPLAVVGLLVALNLTGTACAMQVCHYLSFDYLQFFIAGIVMFYGVQYVGPIAPRGWTVCLGAVVIAVCYGSQFVGWWWSTAIAPSTYTILATAAPMLIVAGALIAEAAGGAIKWRPLILIGDASYAIYLTHTMVFEIIAMGRGRWLQLPPPSESTAIMLATVALATVAGIMVHLYVEHPLLGIIRRRLPARALIRLQVAA
jgi:exopolysaccharide production protein ExoZ